MINILETLHSSFYFANKKKHLICYDPQIAYIYYKDHRVNLLTGVEETYSITEFIKELKSKRIQKKRKFPQVTHFFYEFGHFFNTKVEVDKKTPLVATMIYGKHRFYDYQMGLKKKIIKRETLKKISFESYKENFEFVQENLEAGNCYQVNLTTKDSVDLNDSTSHQDIIEKFYNSRKKLSAYAHHSYIPYLNKLILSNSPECLFQVYEKEKYFSIHALPIKGTISKKVENAREVLLKSLKNQGELYMIIDLLRNDLAKIHLPASKVLFKKKILEVPGLYHLYSRIKVNVTKEITLYDLINALFPGGSITGAPKKKVMEIINELEVGNRGIYCGSTYLDFKNIKTASINIRTAEIDFKKNKCYYGSGGGVTLKSKVKEEFEEIEMKRESFYTLLNKE